MNLSTLLCLTLVSLFDIVLSESSFSQPPADGPTGNYQDNPSYSVGQKVDLQWSSNLTTMDLLIWQEYPMASDTDYYYDTLLNDSRSTSLIWTVTLDGWGTNVRKGESAVFYLEIHPHDSDDVDATSHYFNVSIPDTSTATASASKHATGQATTSSTSEATSGANDSSDSSLSTGAVAGIAVGATIGGLLVLGGIGFLIWKQIRKRNTGENSSQAQPPPPTDSKSPGQESAWIQPPEGNPPVQSPQGIYEAPAQTQRPIYEAP